MCFHSQFILYGSTFPCSCFPPAPLFYLLYPMQGFDFSTSMDYKQTILPEIQKLADNSPETYKLTAAGLLAWGRWKENLRAAKNHTQPGLCSQPEDRRDSETDSRAGSQRVRHSTGLQLAPATCHGLLVRFECSLVDRRINPETNSSPFLSSSGWLWHGVCNTHRLVLNVWAGSSWFSFFHGTFFPCWTKHMQELLQLVQQERRADRHEDRRVEKTCGA